MQFGKLQFKCVLTCMPKRNMICKIALSVKDLKVGTTKKAPAVKNP